MDIAIDIKIYENTSIYTKIYLYVNKNYPKRVFSIIIIER